MKKSASSLSLALISALTLQSNVSLAKEKRENFSADTLALIDANDARDTFRVYLNHKTLVSGINVITDEQSVDQAVSSMKSEKKEGEMTKRSTKGKIISGNGRQLYVSFDPSCSDKSCAYQFTPGSESGEFYLSGVPDKGDHSNNYKIKFLGLGFDGYVKLQYLESDISEFTTEIRVNEGWE